MHLTKLNEFYVNTTCHSLLICQNLAKFPFHASCNIMTSYLMSVSFFSSFCLLLDTHPPSPYLVFPLSQNWKTRPRAGVPCTKVFKHPLIYFINRSLLRLSNLISTRRCQTVFHVMLYHTLCLIVLK